MIGHLPSWKNGAAKSAILDFVAAISAPGEDFVPAAERIAVFGNDGTLWCEQPMQAQVFFAQSRAERLADADPSLKERQPFKAFLEHDLPAIHALGKQSVFEFALAIHSGVTVDDFTRIAKRWLDTATHPATHRHYTQMIYQPQLELMRYLRAQGFKTFIVSAGGADFIRAFAQEVYGIPPEQVIGSTVKTRLENGGSRFSLMKLAELDSFDDREAKVQNIGLHIGRRPVFAFGNSDGDLAMMRYTLAGSGKRMAMLLHHDDAAREAAYDREFRLSPLTEALDRADEFGFRMVSMKNDWEAVYAFDK
ncbi:MAG TPA: HAD family hydrolase [Rhizomicrobium sp.]